jgi:hypothetical protein
VKQIVAVLKQEEVGVPVAELIRKWVTEQTLYRRKKHTRGWNPIKSASSNSSKRRMAG